MTLWLLVALVIGWARRLLGFVPVDENEIPTSALLRAWNGGMPVTLSTPHSPWVTTLSTTANVGAVTYTSWTERPANGGKA